MKTRVLSCRQEGEQKEEGDKRRREEALGELEAILHAVKEHLQAFDRQYLAALLRESHSTAAARAHQHTAGTF